jgi:hypothetical protein
MPFTLEEGRAGIFHALGSPHLVADFGLDFVSWQYQLEEIDREAHTCNAGEYSHQFVFRKSTGALVSVTVTSEHEHAAASAFPKAESVVIRFPGGTSSGYPALIRQLAGGRILIAMGASDPDRPASQLMLIREADLRFFHPWLSHQLESGKHQPQGTPR